MARGQLVSLKGGRFGLAEKMNLVAGELSVHPDGFGFVTPETGGKDIYLVAANLKEAWHGDRVVVRIEGSRGRRREGRVIRILSRRLTDVLGTLSQAGDTYFVEPEDEHLLFNLVIAPEHLNGAAPGQMVRAAVTHYPTGHLNPQGVVTEVLGDVEDAEVQARLVILKYELPDEFPAEVLAAAADINPDLSERALKGRLDLRHLPMVTIDGETARDFDDGVYLEKKPGGGFTLYVSIADVSHYVTPGSPLDKEADQRGTSVYFPQRAVHMLPEKLATDVCSLIPGEDRLAVTAILNFDRRGRRKDFTFARSVVRNHARLTYRLVDDLLVKKDRQLRSRYRPFVKMLTQMTELCDLLRERRAERGSLLMSLPEAEVVLDDRGWPVDVRRVDHLVSHQLIEEFMIAANEAVATYLGELSLFRVHERPDAVKLAAFRTYLKSLGFDLPKEVHRDPRVLREFLDEVRQTPLAPMVQLMLLRSLKQARYAGENLGHYGLATDWYTHFTSPIRRYPDLLIHRLLLARLAGAQTALFPGPGRPGDPGRPSHPAGAGRGRGGAGDAVPHAGALPGPPGGRHLLGPHHRGQRLRLFRLPGGDLCRRPGAPGGPARRLLPLRGIPACASSAAAPGASSPWGIWSGSRWPTWTSGAATSTWCWWKRKKGKKAKRGKGKKG